MHSTIDIKEIEKKMNKQQHKTKQQLLHYSQSTLFLLYQDFKGLDFVYLFTFLFFYIIPFFIIPPEFNQNNL